jgi:hypothetical protein
MSARADLCGGRSAMIVPTATSFKPWFTTDKPTNEMVRRLILLREQEDRRSSF